MSLPEDLPTTDQARIEAYLAELVTQRQLSIHSISAYRRDLAQLCRLAADLPAKPALAALTHVQIRRLAATLHGDGLHPRSIARKLSCWRGFYHWLADHMSLPSNPVDGVRAPRAPRLLPKALDADAAVRLVSTPPAAPNAGSPARLCDHAMFELLYSSGLRVSELTGLDLHYVEDGAYRSAGWLDLDAGEVMAPGKGGKRRSVPVGRPAIAALQRWLAVRAGVLASDQATDRHALFLGQRGRRMAVRSVQQRLKRHAQDVGLPVNVHPHMLRHSFASHLLQSSGDLRAVQELLGHASIAATQAYTALDFQRLAHVYDTAHPRAKKISSKDDDNS